MAKNKTRVAAEHGLLTSETRLNLVIKVDCIATTPSWMLSNTEWDTHAEFEAIMSVCQIASTEAQYEKLFLGAFAGVIKAVTMARLRNITIPVLNYKEMTSSAKLVRPAKRVVDFTATGRECLERVRLEGERRFCGNITEIVDGSLPVQFRDSELLATILDIRTVHCKHLTKTQRKLATRLYVEEYIKFYRKADLFEKEAEARKAIMAVELKAQTRAPAAAAAMAGPSVGENEDDNPFKVPTEAFISTTGDNRWSSDESISGNENEEETQLTDKEIGVIAKKVLLNF